MRVKALIVALALALAFALGTATLLPAQASAAPAAPQRALGVPTSTMTVDGNDLKYCVTGYAPNRDVTVAEAGAAPVTLHTHISGAGCTQLPGHAQCDRVVVTSAVATGTGADGNPATSRASLREPPDPANCSPTGSGSGHPAAAGGGSLSGAEIGLWTLLGVLVLALLTAGVAALRRR